VPQSGIDIHLVARQDAEQFNMILVEIISRAVPNASRKNLGTGMIPVPRGEVGNIEEVKGIEFYFPAMEIVGVVKMGAGTTGRRALQPLTRTIEGTRCAVARIVGGWRCLRL